MSSSKDLGVLVVTLNCSSHQKNYSFITRWIHLLKNGPFPATFFLIFVFSTQLTENKCSIKVCRWLDLNRGSLVSEATALPAKPQPLPKDTPFSYLVDIVSDNCSKNTKLASVFRLKSLHLINRMEVNFWSVISTKCYRLCVNVGRRPCVYGTVNDLEKPYENPYLN